MQTNKLRVGSITANYNNAQYISECIDGLLGQTYQIDNIVIVDDASKDDSVNVVLKHIESKGGVWENSSDFPNVSIGYFKNNPSQTIWLFRQEKNLGPANTRNVGLKFLLDNTDVICVADSDDVLYPTKIEKSVSIMRKYPELALVYSDYDVYHQKSGELKREFKEPFSYNRLFEECIVSNNSMYASSIIKIVGGYDPDLFGPEDYDLWLRIAEVAAVYHIPEALYKYRLTGNNITQTTPTAKFAEHVRKVHEKAIKRNYEKNNR